MFSYKKEEKPKSLKKKMSQSSIEDQCEYLMTFGKHKGKSLREIASNKKDRTYLEWILKQDFHEKFILRVQVVLEHVTVNK